MTIPFGYNRPMAFVYRGKPVEVRIMWTETVDVTVMDAPITRTYQSYEIVSLIAAEKKAKEGHTRNFTFLVKDYPEDPPSTTSRLVYQDLEYEISGYTTDGVVFDIFTYRP